MKYLLCCPIQNYNRFLFQQKPQEIPAPASQGETIDPVKGEKSIDENESAAPQEACKLIDGKCADLNKAETINGFIEKDGKKFDMRVNKADIPNNPLDYIQITAGVDRKTARNIIISALSSPEARRAFRNNNDTFVNSGAKFGKLTATKIKALIARYEKTK